MEISSNTYMFDLCHYQTYNLSPKKLDYTGCHQLYIFNRIILLFNIHQKRNLSYTPVRYNILNHSYYKRKVLSI